VIRLRHQLRGALWSAVTIIWLPVAALLMAPVVARAAPTVETAQFILSLTPSLVIAFAWILSSLSGATALLIRLDRQLAADPPKPLARPLLSCASHIAGSWLAGVLAFMLSLRLGLDVWELFVGVICASFLGATFIERLAERYTHRMQPLRVGP
jgi:hypothetical protein